MRVPVPAVLLLAAACAQTPTPTPAPAAGAVRPGIEVFLADIPQRIRGKRVALLTNNSGIDRARNLDIDLIAKHKDLKLVALLAAEHGIRGDAMNGVRIEDETDPKTGVPVYSLYKAEDRGPSEQMLKDADVIIYDLQEVGGRTWTYVSSMALSMQAAAKKGIPFVVLDRPNPIGGEIVEGALVEEKFKSFVGIYPIPARHGMTVGELATLFNQKFGINSDLIVVRTENWRRSQWQDETGLPWVNPSPNLRSLAALSSYPGSVYFEGTNISEGRGTDRPFEQIGAPWLNATEVVRVMHEKRLPGIRFEATMLTVASTAAKYPGQTIPGIRFAITDRQAYRPVRTALVLIDEIRRQHPSNFTWRTSIDRLTGSDKVRLAIEAGTLAPLLEEWDREAAVRYTKVGLAKKQKANVTVEWIIMIVSKLFYIGYIFVLPLVLTSLFWWQVLIGVVIMHYISGFILAIIFQPAHVIEGTEFPVPDMNDTLENTWVVHQLLTTTNFANKSRWFSWYVGGLNFQIEHHLFPNVCHVHYRKIAGIVKETAIEFGLPYKSVNTFMGALVGHGRLLKQLGMKPMLAN